MGYRVALILHKINRREPWSWVVIYVCHVFVKMLSGSATGKEGLFQVLLWILFTMAPKPGVT